MLAAGDAGVPGSGGWGRGISTARSLRTARRPSIATDPNATVTLLNGDAANPSTTFDVADGVLTVSLPIYDGIDGHTTGGSYLLAHHGVGEDGRRHVGPERRQPLQRRDDDQRRRDQHRQPGDGRRRFAASAPVRALRLTAAGCCTPARAPRRSIARSRWARAAACSDRAAANLTYTTAITGVGRVHVPGQRRVDPLGQRRQHVFRRDHGFRRQAGVGEDVGLRVAGRFHACQRGTVVVQNANQFPTTAVVTFAGAGGSTLEVYGRSVTVGGISGSGVIENTETETGVGNGSLVVNNSANCTFSGTLRNSLGGSSTFSLTKGGAGVLTLVGANTGQYTGTLTVNAGTLDYSAARCPRATTRLPAAR